MYYWKEEVGRHAQILFYKKKVWNNFFSVSSLWIFALQEWRLSNEMEFFFYVIENNAMMSKTAMSVLSKMGSRIPSVEGF